MKIKWLKQATFQIKSEKTIVTDPHNKILGDLPPNLTADIVTVSHNHGDHNYTEGVGGNPKVINTTGSFKVDDIDIKGIASLHDSKNGSERGSNIIYVFELEGLKICHLGDLGHLLTNSQIKDIGNVDILLIPVGGVYTINASEAVQVVSQINPKVVIPMHYKPNNYSSYPYPIETADSFVKQLKWKTKENVIELEINTSNIGQFDQTIILFKI